MELSKATKQSMGEVEDVLEELLRSAEQEIKLSTALTTGIFTHKGLISALGEALNKLENDLPDGSKPFKVLLDKGVPAGKEDTYRWWFSNPKVDCRRSRESIPHMMIIDRVNFRIEEPHTDADSTRSNTLVLDGTDELVGEVNGLFDRCFKAGAQLQFDPRTATSTPNRL